MGVRAWGWVCVVVALATGAAQAAQGAGQATPDKPKPSPSAEAQKTPKPTPSAEAQKAPEPVSNDPQTTTATYGDWTERCQRLTLSDGVRRVCEVAETVTANGQPQPIAELAIGRLKKGAPLRLTLVLPVNVGFPSAPKVTAAGADPVELAWKQCVPAGCFGEAAFTAETQQAWREAKAAKVESRAASGASFNFEISLRGLPQALDALAHEP